MNKISLHTENSLDVTLIPNIFIDQYMPSANGAYVKVYLFLLRSLQSACFEFSISHIADSLDNTEKDIVRALNYWKKMNVLSLGTNEQKDITDIRLNNLHSSTNNATEALLHKSHLKDLTQDSQLSEIAVTIHTDRKPALRQSYSAEKVEQLSNNDEIKYAMHIVEVYLGRPLKPVDHQLILYLSEELHFSSELIMYLYEYCVSRGKKSASYVEAVALKWAEEGIDTEEKAKEAVVTYNEHFNTVNKAFGLNRAPGQIERQYIKKWVEVFHFTGEILTDACNRTILRTQRPDYKYTDKILETWFKKGVKTMEDIKRLDEEFSRGNKSSSEKSNSTSNPTKPSTNKFNQYPQRNYSAKDYAELERKLLNKGL